MDFVLHIKSLRGENESTDFYVFRGCYWIFGFEKIIFNLGGTVMVVWYRFQMSYVLDGGVK